jgi:hypothetical protein
VYIDSDPSCGMVELALRAGASPGIGEEKGFAVTAPAVMLSLSI